MCADICVHDTGGGNTHAHVMLTMCQATRYLFQIQEEKNADRNWANPVYGGVGLSERRDERQDHHSDKGMESGVCQAEHTQSEVSCSERGSARDRTDTKGCLQYLVAGTSTAQDIEQ